MELANSIVTLQPGMYILRHPKTGLPPISISRAAGKKEHNGAIQALYTPSTDGSVLRDGRDCIVMQVLNAPVDLLVTAYLDKAGAAVPALKVDKIALDGEATTTKSITVPTKGISIIGHIERVGDVVAPAGERVGEPERGLRLEGFQVMWPDKPEGVDIAYSVRIENSGESPTVNTGHFCGSRNAAKRLVGVTFTLVGPKASEYGLVGEAMFSGGFRYELASASPVCGPTGMEHLTALRIAVKSAPAKTGPWQASAKTKIFRASKAQVGTRKS